MAFETFFLTDIANKLLFVEFYPALPYSVLRSIFCDNADLVSNPYFLSHYCTRDVEKFSFRRMEFSIEFNIIWSVHREQVVHNAQVDFTKKKKKRKRKKEV